MHHAPKDVSLQKDPPSGGSFVQSVALWTIVISLVRILRQGEKTHERKRRRREDELSKREGEAY